VAEVVVFPQAVNRSSNPTKSEAMIFLLCKSNIIPPYNVNDNYSHLL